MKRRRFRCGSWRQAVVTLAGVLPMSVALNIGLDPLTSDWPRLATVVANATVLVASLTWVLLPALHWATGGWAAPYARSPGEPRRRHGEPCDERRPRAVRRSGRLEP